MSEGAYEPLGNVIRLIAERSDSLKDPSKPYVGLEHIRPGGGSLIGLGIAEDSVSLNSTFHSWDVLFGKLRPRLRKSVQVRFDGYCSTDILVLRPSERTQPCFAGYLLQTDEVFNEAIRTEEGTKMPRCSWNTLRKLEVFVPTITQQVSIAEILGSLDSAIELTEALIAKMQQVKAGLMHDLFTRGILPNGQLRPAREEAPQLYKQSPLGWIPNKWKQVLVRDIVPRAGYGISTPLGIGSGIPVLRMNNLKNGEVDVSDLKYSDSPKAMALQLSDGDVLFNRTNSMEHVGRAGIWRGQLTQASFASYLVRLEPNRESVRHEFLNSWLNWPTAQAMIRKFATPGVHQVNINPTNLGKTLIALPASLGEQDMMMDVLQEGKRFMHELESDLKALNDLKSGLMQDLLTGRVRIPVSRLKTIRA